MNATTSVHFFAGMLAESMIGEWRERLGDAVSASGMSKREISRKAGLGENFVAQIFNAQQRVPSVENLAQICDALNVSLYSILTGTKMDREAEALVREYQGLSDDGKKNVFGLVRELPKAASK